MQQYLTLNTKSQQMHRQVRANYEKDADMQPESNGDRGFKFFKI